MTNFFNLLTKESITVLKSPSLGDKEKINYFFIFLLKTMKIFFIYFQVFNKIQIILFIIKTKFIFLTV